jgi:FtsH-binding integral membrane protein
MPRHAIAIWFFVGALLLVYGALILGAGVWEWLHPRQSAVVLANLHLSVWWGAGLVILGLVYVLRYRPRPDK